jgi:hypothetical protein
MAPAVRSAACTSCPAGGPPARALRDAPADAGIGPFIRTFGPYRYAAALCMVPASSLRDAPGAWRAAFADTFNAAEVMAMRPGDRKCAPGPAGQCRRRDPGRTGEAHVEDDGKPWQAGQPAREDGTRAVMPGAAGPGVAPVAWQARTGDSYAL